MRELWGFPTCSFVLQADRKRQGNDIGPTWNRRGFDVGVQPANDKCARTGADLLRRVNGQLVLFNCQRTEVQDRRSGGQMEAICLQFVRLMAKGSKGQVVGVEDRARVGPADGRDEKVGGAGNSREGEAEDGGARLPVCGRAGHFLAGGYSQSPYLASAAWTPWSLLLGATHVATRLTRGWALSMATPTPATWSMPTSLGASPMAMTLRMCTP